MHLVFENGPNDQAERLILLAIADNADDGGMAFPGITLLAQKSCMSERHCMRVIQKMETDGWMLVQRRATGFARKGNVYRLNVTKLAVSHDTAMSLQNSRDITSLDAKKRIANKGTYKPSSDTMSPEKSHDKMSPHQVTSEQSQVTKSPTSSDIACGQIKRNQQHAIYNHQEPSMEPPIEPSNTPLPPFPGGEKKLNGAQEKDGLTPLELTLATLLGKGPKHPGEATVGMYRPETAPLIAQAREFLLCLYDEFAKHYGMSTQAAQTKNPNWEDPLAAWKRCFDHVSVADCEMSENDVPLLTLATPQPHDLADGLSKYSVKVKQAMKKAFGREVQLQPRLEAV